MATNLILAHRDSTVGTALGGVFWVPHFQFEGAGTRRVPRERGVYGHSDDALRLRDLLTEILESVRHQKG